MYKRQTNGRVGYVYIPDMGPDGLNEFARYFYPQLDKEALIDVYKRQPLQSGVGNIANAVLGALGRDKTIPAFEMYTEVLQDAVVDLIRQGRVKFGSTCSDVYKRQQHLLRIHLMLGKVLHINLAEITQSGMHRHLSLIHI